MKIIDDTQVFEPNECYFGLDCVEEEEVEDDIVVVLITDKENWDNDHCLNDCFGSQSLPDGILPDSMSEVSEATWTSHSSLEEVRALLLSLGFTECNAISEIAQNYY